MLPDDRIRLKHMLDATQTAIGFLRARARQAAEYTDEYVHDNPWSSIGAAAALGLLIGVLLGRR